MTGVLVCRFTEKDNMVNMVDGANNCVFPVKYCYFHTKHLRMGYSDADVVLSVCVYQHTRFTIRKQ